MNGGNNSESVIAMAGAQRSSSGSRTVIIVLTVLLGMLIVENVMFRRIGFLGFLSYQNRLTSALARSVSREQCLQTHFEKYGSSLDDVMLSPLLSRSRDRYPPVLLVAASNKEYKYASAWQQHRTDENVPFVLFKTQGTLRNGELTPHYARVPSLLAVIACLPGAHLLAYSDMDTLLDVAHIPALATKSSRPVTISWKIERRSKTFRTNWFLVKSRHPEATHFLLTWFYNGRRALYQDQTVLNDLYRRKLWFREAIHAVDVRFVQHVELRHCYSALKNRRKCMESLQLKNRVTPVAVKANKTAAS